MADNIVFRLQKIHGLNEAEQAGLTTDPRAITVTDPGWTNTLFFQVLYQRDTTKAVASRPANVRLVHIKDGAIFIGVKSIMYPTICDLRFGYLLIGGSLQKSLSRKSLLTCSSVEELEDQYLMVLTVLYAWSKNECFKNESVIEMPKYVDPSEMPRWEGDPHCFVM